MKKITALLLCFLLLCSYSLGALADEPQDEEKKTVISSSVPDTHKIKISAENADVFYEGVGGEEFIVDRLSVPRILIRADSGKVIKSVFINGEDVAERLDGGYLELSSIYEDKVITVVTEDEPSESEDSYTVKGKITLNGEPMSNVVLELRSTLKTTSTDINGSFSFADVEAGEHSLTAIRESKVIGFLSFALQKDMSTNVNLLENGAYTINVAENSAGIELNLELNEEKGTLIPSGAKALQKDSHNSPDSGNITRILWLLLLLILIIICIVVLEINRKKKKAK